MGAGCDLCCEFWVGWDCSVEVGCGAGVGGVWLVLEQVEEGADEEEAEEPEEPVSRLCPGRVGITDRDELCPAITC